MVADGRGVGVKNREYLPTSKMDFAIILPILKWLATKQPSTRLGLWADYGRLHSKHVLRTI